METDGLSEEDKKDLHKKFGRFVAHFPPLLSFFLLLAVVQGNPHPRHIRTHTHTHTHTLTHSLTHSLTHTHTCMHMRDTYVRL